MDSTASKCPHCNEGQLVSEGYDSLSSTSAQRVCESCGMVVAEGAFSISDSSLSMTFCGEKGRPYNQSIPYRNTWADTPKIPAGKTLGLNTIKQASSVLGLKTHLTETATDLYNHLYAIDKFHLCSLENKLRLSVGCVYVACRQANHPVTMYQMAPLAECSPKELGQLIKVILTELSIVLTTTDITELVDTYCGKKFDRSVLEMSKNILTICKDVWIVEGRQPEILIMAACYLAWQFKNFQEGITLKRKVYLKIHNITGGAHYHLRRIQEMQGILGKMAKEIPWVTDDFDKKPDSIIEHIPDIIKYRNTLIHEAIARYNKNEHLKTEANALAVNSDESASNVVKNIHANEASDAGTSKEGTKPNIDTFSNSKKRKNPHTTCASNLLIMPPSSLNELNKKKICLDSAKDDVPQTPDLSHLDSPILSEKDIPDSEMDQYVLQNSDMTVMNHMSNRADKPRK